MEETQNTVRDLVEQIDLIKKEVDSLQIAVAKENAPWYANIPTIISLIALLFSFGTTYVSYSRARTQDIHNLKAELRSMLQRLAFLPKENFDIAKKYTDDPGGVRLLSGFISQENALLVRQAADIIKLLPREQVSSAEYYSIAIALQASNNMGGAIDFLRLAIKNADNMNDEVASLRGHADTLFLTGQQEEGRVEYQKALGIFSKYKGYNDYTQKSTNVWTELAWAISEANIGNLNLANQHVTNAESIISTLFPGPGVELLKKQTAQVKSMLASGTPSGIPTPLPTPLPTPQ